METKFQGLLKKTKLATTTEESDAASSSTKPKLAKSKDKAYRHTALLLKVATTAEAQYLVKLNRDEEDFSSLVEKLLVEWIAKEKKAAESKAKS